MSNTVTVSHKALNEALAFIKAGVENSKTMPVLACVHLALRDGQLLVQSTTLELSLSRYVPVSGPCVDNEASVAVPFKKFQEFVTKLKSEYVMLTLDDSSVAVQGGTARANIKGYDGSEFPAVPTLGQREPLRLDRVALAKAIKQVAFAAATDEARPILTGIFITKPEDSDTVEMAASDGYRVAVSRVYAPSLGAFSVIVPLKAASTILSVKTGEASMYIMDGRMVGFRFDDNSEVISTLIEGSFPDYQRVIPKTHTTLVLVSGEGLAELVRSAMVIAADASSVVRVYVEQNNGIESPGRIIVTASAADLGEFTGDIAATVAGGPIEIGLNGKFLLAALGSLEGPVALYMTQNTAPVKMVDTTAPEACLHVIMPMHLGR